MIEINQVAGGKNVYRLETIDTETNELLGFAELRGTEKPVPVFFCKVEEAYMGKKIGTNMLKNVIQYAKSIQCEGIFARFDGNVRARMMLKKQGFRLYTNEIALLEF